MSMHLDEFTLLRFTTRDLSADELGTVSSHLAVCNECGSVLSQIGRLDVELRGLASAAAKEWPEETFARDDPFRSRPSVRAPGYERANLRAAVETSESAVTLQDSILEAAKEPEGPKALLSTLSLTKTEHRFAVLYALQEAGRRIAEDPFKVMALAKAAIAWLHNQRKRELEEGFEFELAERMVPRLVLRAQANLLFGTGCLWTKEFSRAGAHLVVAYRSFAGCGDETSLALVEWAEAQRRALAGEGWPALELARRARGTFESEGLQDYAARALMAEGLAHYALDRQDKAVESYRQALPIFERYGLWSNYVGALNSIATSLTKRGHFNEARREYARAFRRFSREHHRYWLGYLRIGLAEVLVAAGHPAEGAVSAARAARVFMEASLRPHALIAMLLEVECWARHGSLDRARHRLELFWNEIDRDGAVDRVVIRELADALSGANPDFEKLSSLRDQLSGLIQKHYRTPSIPA